MLQTSSDPLLELTLELRDRYRDLDSTIDALETGSTEAVDSIGEKMTAIKQIESELAPLREAYQRRHTNLPPSLKDPTDQTIELLRGLMPKLAQLEKATLDSFERLFPKIQESVRAVKMQSAYGSRSS